MDSKSVIEVYTVFMIGTRSSQERKSLFKGLVNNFVTTYPVDGTNEVEKPTYKDGNVYINEKQYSEINEKLDEIMAKLFKFMNNIEKRTPYGFFKKYAQNKKIF